MVGGDEDSYKILEKRISQLRNEILTSTKGIETDESKKYKLLLDWLDDYKDKWGEAAEERLNTIKKESLELQKQQAEFARS